MPSRRVAHRRLALHKIGRLGDDQRSRDQRLRLSLKEFETGEMMSIATISGCDERPGIDDEQDSAASEAISEQIVDPITDPVLGFPNRPERQSSRAGPRSIGG